MRVADIERQIRLKQRQLNNALEQLQSKLNTNRAKQGAIEELREHSAGDAQQGALIAQLERALSSAVFDDAAAGGAQKMANAVARDWQSASFPGVYTQFELPPPAARLRRRAPPFTTMMQGEFLFLFTVTFHANHAHNLSPSLP